MTAGRKFNPTWLSSRPWLRYSVKNDSLYCISCVCFGAAASESPFVSTGFRNCKKALGRKHSYIEQHKRSESHKVAEEKVAIFLHTVSLAQILHHFCQSKLHSNSLVQRRGFCQ